MINPLNKGKCCLGVTLPFHSLLFTPSNIKVDNEPQYQKGSEGFHSFLTYSADKECVLGGSDGCFIDSRGECRDSGNDFRFPNFVLHTGRVCLIFFLV